MYSRTYVECRLIFLVDNKSNFADGCWRLRMVCTELVTLIKQAAGDHVRRKVETTCSDSRNGDCLQLAFVCRLQNVLDEMSQNLNNNVTSALCATTFSERQLEFTFAICCRSSVCGLSICLSVTFVRPTQPVEIFGNVYALFGTLAIRWHLRKILRRSSQGNPSVGGGG